MEGGGICGGVVICFCGMLVGLFLCRFCFLCSIRCN